MSERPALIGVDWGTTSLRACLLSADGTILEEREAAAGVMRVAPGEFEPVLRREIRGWPAHLPVIASGMVGSRQGWIEVPYVHCPAGFDEVARGTQAARSEDGRTVYLVPGVTGRDAQGVPDVIRGEETQILGMLAVAPAAGLALLPGTHSKWVRIEHGRIAQFATLMTGELYAILKEHSILGRLMAGEDPDEAAFERGVRYGLLAEEGVGGLLRRLFSARTHALMADLEETAVASYLSGLLIGCEIREARACMGEALAGEVALIAGTLAEPYTHALNIAAIDAAVQPPAAAARGHAAIARALALTGEDR